MGGRGRSGNYGARRKRKEGPLGLIVSCNKRQKERRVVQPTCIHIEVYILCKGSDSAY